MSEVLKHVALSLLSDRQIFKKFVTVLLVVVIAFFTPVMAVVQVLNSDFRINTNELESLIMANMTEEQKAQLAQIDSHLHTIDSRMEAAGYASRKKEAEVLYLLALYDRSPDSAMIDKLIRCFKDNQSDEQLVAAVNSVFGTSVKVQDFTNIMNTIRSTALDISDYVDPTTKNNRDLVKWAQHAEKAGWGYVWGTYGGVLNKQMFEHKCKQYPDQVGGMADFIEKNWLGGRTADCVGLIKGYGWLNPETLQMEYATNGMKDVSADQMYKNAKVKGVSSTMPEVPGLAVWKQGHIGIYIGNGEVIEAMGTKYGVVKTKFSTKRWTHWLQIPYIEYLDEVPH